jgi:hypothetical protein
MSAWAGVERAVIEYLANALWQLPVLAAGAWLLVQGFQPGVLAQHRVWVVVLGLAVVLPGLGIGRDGASAGSVAAGGSPAAAETAVAAVGTAGISSGISAGALTASGSAQADGTMAGRAMATRRELVRVRRVRLTARATDLLVGLYGATLTFGLLRIVRAWTVARGLVRRSRETTGAEQGLEEWEPELLGDYGGGRLLGLGELPELRESAEVTSPVVVGAWAPVLLLPEGMGRYTREEVRAVLCHELAHVARRDYLANLACQVAGVPLGWHPLLHAVQRQIRRTREMVCDRMAAREMESELVYARCLLRLAREMFGAGRVAEPGVGLFGSNVLEERVMRLIERNEMRLRTRLVRMAWGAVGMASALTVAAVVHVTPTWAAVERAAVAPMLVAQAGGAAGQESRLVPPVPPAAPAMPAAPVAAAKPSPVPSPAPAPAPMPAVAPVAGQTPAPAPAPVVSPVPPVPPTPAAPGVVGADDRNDDRHNVTIVNGVQRPLTPEEQRALDREMAEMQRQVKAATANLPGPEVQRQLDRQMQELDRRIAEATAKFDSAEFRAQVAEAERKAAEATAKVNSPEFRARLDEAARKAANAEAMVNSPAFKQKLAEAQRKGAEAEAMVNSPEFQQRLQKAQEQMQRAAEEMEKAARQMQAEHPEAPAPK